MKHLLNIDEQLWTEWQLEELDGMVSDPAYFFDRAREVMKPIKYSQREFKDMPSTLCTLYGNMNALASRIGRELTIAERRELCQLRLADKDYKPEFWGFTSAWCDTVRRWWNTHNPENLIVTFAIDVTSELWKKFFSKNFPVATSVRLNSAYAIDSKDWTMNETSWGKTTGWHCRMRIGMKFHDNYFINKQWREYEYPSIENYLDSVDNWYERPIIHAFFLEKELSWDWKRLVDAMKKWWWDGSRSNDNLTRFESSAIAFRIWKWVVPIEKIWNQKWPNDAVSRYEFSVMVNRADKSRELYLWTDRNRSITRKEAILLLS